MRPAAKTDTEDSRATSATGGVRGPPATQENLLLRLAVEHFLFEEAAHLDNWRRTTGWRSSPRTPATSCLPPTCRTEIRGAT